MVFFLKLRHWELFMMLVLFGWMFSIGAWANRQLHESRRRSPLPFAVGLLLPIVYLLMYIFLYISLLQEGVPSKPPLWLLPMYMFSMVGIFYGLWYSARQLKSLQENAEADFMIFRSAFFLLFIFPLGIWLIQPSVNQLYAKLEPGPAEPNEG